MSYSYYDNEEEFDSRKIDYDLVACLEYNDQKNFSVHDIEKVLAVHEGENDGEDWHWILELKNGKFVYLRGGCDYTGWDCQSWASSQICDSVEDCLNILKDLSLPVTEKNTPANAGMGHMIRLLFGDYTAKDNEIYLELEEQLKTKKKLTWREETKNDFPDLPKI